MRKKFPATPNESHGEAAEGGAKHARHIELRRVERDGVGEIFSRDELRHQRLISWRVERHGNAGAKREQR